MAFGAGASITLPSLVTRHSSLLVFDIGPWNTHCYEEGMDLPTRISEMK